MNRYFPLFNLSSVYSTNASGAERDDFSVSNAKQCIFQCLILIVECASLSLLFTRCCLSVILLFDGRLFVCLLNKTRDFDLYSVSNQNDPVEGRSFPIQDWLSRFGRKRHGDFSVNTLQLPMRPRALPKCRKGRPEETTWPVCLKFRDERKMNFGSQELSLYFLIPTPLSLKLIK